MIVSILLSKTLQNLSELKGDFYEQLDQWFLYHGNMRLRGKIPSEQNWTF